MKRILGILLWGSFISMFFTGCSFGLIENETDPSSLAQSIMNEETSGDGIRMNYKEEDRKKAVPDYFQENVEKKFQNLEGKQAFRIPDEHSKETKDIELFQIGDLTSDGTFYYCYSTWEAGSGSERKKVHCAAAFNYRTGTFKVLHENRFKPESIPEDGESFYMQVCWEEEEEPKIFVYDNGIGTLYQNDGKVLLKTDIETLIRSRYHQAFSVNVTHVMTDGENKMYLELVIEKNQVNLPEKPDSEERPGDKEQEEEEEEQVEKDLEDNVVSMLMVYEFTPVGGSIVQNNLKHEEQKQKWIKMAEGKEFSEDPDGVEDWKSAVKQIPVQWGSGFLDGYKFLEIMRWKNGIQFDSSKDDTFDPVIGSYEGFAKVETNSELADTFVMDGVSWCSVGGKTGGSQTPFDEETIIRNYVLETTDTWFDSEGKPHTVTKKENKQQSIKVTRKLGTPVSECWVEGYWFVKDAHTLGGRLNQNMLASSDEKIFWIHPDRSITSAGYIEEEGMAPGMFQDGDNTYLIQYNGKKMLIAQGESWDEAEVCWEVPFSRMTSRYERGSSEYDQAFDMLNEESLKEEDVYSNSDHYTEENVLKVDFTLEEDSEYNGFLFTSHNKGILLYEPAKEEVMMLAEGSWYRSWKQDETYISVGFSRKEATYDSMDVAFARVYEYDLKELCQEALEEARNQLESASASEGAGTDSSSESQSEAGEEETVKRDPTESGEGLLDGLEIEPMEDTWKEQHKPVWTGEDFKSANEQGETFDSSEYASRESEREENKESSQAARIDEILESMMRGESEGDTVSEGGE